MSTYALALEAKAQAGAYAHALDTAPGTGIVVRPHAMFNAEITNTPLTNITRTTSYPKPEDFTNVGAGPGQVVPFRRYPGGPPPTARYPPLPGQRGYHQHMLDLEQIQRQRQIEQDWPGVRNRFLQRVGGGVGDVINTWKVGKNIWRQGKRIKDIWDARSKVVPVQHVDDVVIDKTGKPRLRSGRRYRSRLGGGIHIIPSFAMSTGTDGFGLIDLPRFGGTGGSEDPFLPMTEQAFTP